MGGLYVKVYFYNIRNNVREESSQTVMTPISDTERRRRRCGLLCPVQHFSEALQNAVPRFVIAGVLELVAER